MAHIPHLRTLLTTELTALSTALAQTTLAAGHFGTIDFARSLAPKPILSFSDLVGELRSAFGSPAAIESGMCRGGPTGVQAVLEAVQNWMVTEESEGWGELIEWTVAVRCAVERCGGGEIDAEALIQSLSVWPDANLPDVIPNARAESEAPILDLDFVDPADIFQPPMLRPLPHLSTSPAAELPNSPTPTFDAPPIKFSPTSPHKNLRKLPRKVRFALPSVPSFEIGTAVMGFWPQHCSWPAVIIDPDSIVGRWNEKVPQGNRTSTSVLLKELPAGVELLWAEPEDLVLPSPLCTIAETYKSGNSPGLNDQELFRIGLEISLNEDRLREWVTQPTDAELEDERAWREHQEALLEAQDPDFAIEGSKNVGGFARPDSVTGKKRKKGVEEKKVKRGRTQESEKRATRKSRQAVDPRVNDIVVNKELR